MNNKELILSKINELRFTNKHGDEFEYGFNNALDCISNFLNSLPAEYPSEELMIAAQSYTEKGSQCQDEMDAFIAGANWQKWYMMKGLCFETKVYQDCDGDDIESPFQTGLSLEQNEITALPNLGLSDGDKVKVIIVKEDKQ